MPKNDQVFFLSSKKFFVLILHGEAHEQVGEAADDEPIPEVLADDGAGLLHDLPNNVVAALAELKKAENEFVDRRVGGRVRRRNQFLDE